MTVTYRRFAGALSIVTALTGITFTVTFAIAVREGEHWALWASSVALLVYGLVALPVFLALGEQLGTAEPQFARLGVVLGVVGSLGAALHGAWDVAVLANPVKPVDVPSYADPRGFATFALTGLALALLGWLVLRTSVVPRVLGALALVDAVMLLVVYFGRLIALDPNRPVIKWVAVVSGLVVGPAFFLAYARAVLLAAR